MQEEKILIETKISKHTLSSLSSASTSSSDALDAFPTSIVATSSSELNVMQVFLTGEVDSD